MMSDSEDKKPVVPCLMGIGQLQLSAESQFFKVGDDTRRFLVRLMLKKLGIYHVQKVITKFQAEGLISWEDDLYEVEDIIDHCENEETGDLYYLIKWVGWKDEHNTWEPRANLQCDEEIERYTAQIGTEERGVKRKYKDITKNEINSRTLTVDELINKVTSSKALTSLSPMDILKLYSPAREMKRIEQFMGLNPSLTKRYQIRPRIKAVGKSSKVKKADIAQALKEWENKLNEISRSVDMAPITVVNDVDLEGPPENFVYINHCKEGPGVVIPRDPPVGCDCEDCFNCKSTCCAACSGTDFAYYKNGRIRLPPGRPVYECNSRCKCNTKCVNRVVQKGRKYKTCIFRTKNGRGWGVKTLQLIKKGSFVMEYVGEVITHEEAERRGQEYDAAGRTYLFDLDFADSNTSLTEGSTSFTVDAGVYGNAAHFINHSCDPNMEVYCVWVNCLDPRLPHICLFAKRDIQKNEELSFDYLCSRTNQEDETETAAANIAIEEDLEVSFREVPSTFSPPSTPPPPSSPTKQPTEVESDSVESGDNVAVGELGDGFSNKGIAISPKKSSSMPVNSFSMICQCGAAKCRKYLF